METFTILYTLFGGLGLFFYGMKTMSDSIQAIAGDMIKNIINSLTTNRFLAVAVGLVVTMIVQSSSITTVMVVGFVNASLMNLTQAIGVIFGANIGTTITGWIISIKIGKYGLLLIGLGIFPALFAKTERMQQLGRVLFGLGLIFTGLETMSDSFKPLRKNQAFLDSISAFSGNNYASFFASTIMGCLLTMIVQSSSAMLGITIALASTSVINFHTASALVLGENIGTTITAILASVGANTNAKRAARAHAIFNILGVTLIYTILPLYFDFIEWFVPGEADFVDATGNRPNIAAHIAATHTFFNVAATLSFLPFIKTLANFVTKITPESKTKEKPHLVVLGNPQDILPATAIVQAHSEIKKFKDIVDRQYKLTREYIGLKETNQKMLDKIRDYEVITDNIQKEITIFLCYVMEKSLTRAQSVETQSMIRVADELESIADYLERIATYKSKMVGENSVSGPALDECIEYLEEVWKFFELTVTGIYDEKSHDVELCVKKSEQLNTWANDMRDRHIERVSKGEYKAVTSMTYSDMVVAIRKVRAHALNIAQALDGQIEANEED